MNFWTAQTRSLLWVADNSNYECHTNRLWEYIFTRKIFKGESWVVSSQQPPTPPETGDLRLVDLTVEKWTPNGKKKLLCMTAKRPNPTTEELITLEYQAFTVAFANCEFFLENRVPIVTCAGGLVRLWIFERGDDYLTPWFPATGSGMGAKSEYVHLDSPQGDEVIRALKCIRDYDLPSAKSLPSNCSPRPTNVTLPDGWETMVSPGSSADELMYQGDWPFISPPLNSTPVISTPVYEQEAGSSSRGTKKTSPTGHKQTYQHWHVPSIPAYEQEAGSSSHGTKKTSPTGHKQRYQHWHVPSIPAYEQEAGSSSHGTETNRPTGHKQTYQHWHVPSIPAYEQEAGSSSRGTKTTSPTGHKQTYQHWHAPSIPLYKQGVSSSAHRTETNRPTGYEQMCQGKWLVPSIPAYEQKAGSSSRGTETTSPTGNKQTYQGNQPDLSTPVYEYKAGPRIQGIERDIPIGPDFF